MSSAELKSTNPKDLIGSDKLPIHLWPFAATVLGSLGLWTGMLKYGRSNWRKSGVRFSIYFDAMMRHANALYEGEDLDPETQLPHEAHILACIGIIVDAKAQGKLVDDRAYTEKPGWLRKWMDDVTPHVARLKTFYADKDPKHWTHADNKAEGGYFIPGPGGDAWTGKTVHLSTGMSQEEIDEEIRKCLPASPA